MHLCNTLRRMQITRPWPDAEVELKGCSYPTANYGKHTHISEVHGEVFNSQVHCLDQTQCAVTFSLKGQASQRLGPFFQIELLKADRSSARTYKYDVALGSLVLQTPSQAMGPAPWRL